jgi:hypothetical protein
VASSSLSHLVDRATFERVAPGMTIGAAPLPEGFRAAPPSAGVVEALRAHGHAQLPLASREQAAAMALAVRSLCDAEIHPVFAFVFDPFWDLLARLAPTMRAVLGEDCVALADFWAWRVLPGRAGWPPHRGVYERVQRPGELPSLVTVWVALTDVTAVDACMHLVEREHDTDPDLGAIRFDPAHGRALLASAGDALIWSADLIHWGGACRADARGPRVSCAFSFKARAWPSDVEPLPRAAPPFEDRLDLIASQIATYGHQDAVGDALTRWAHMLLAMRTMAARRRSR